MLLSTFIISPCFYLIRQLRQIRSSLDYHYAILLANSLVSSKLDYCNSLYCKLPSASISRLQRIQNSLAGVVCPTAKRTDHISPVLRKLHWLPHIKLLFSPSKLKHIKNRRTCMNCSHLINLPEALDHQINIYLLYQILNLLKVNDLLILLLQLFGTLYL